MLGKGRSQESKGRPEELPEHYFASLFPKGLSTQAAAELMYPPLHPVLIQHQP